MTQTFKKGTNVKRIKAALLFAVLTSTFSLAHAVSLKDVAVTLNNLELRAAMGSMNIESIKDSTQEGIKCMCRTITITLTDKTSGSRTTRKVLEVDVDFGKVTTIKDVTYQPN